MTCCPNASFELLAGGLQVREQQLQDNSEVYQFFPYRAIQSVRFWYDKDTREGLISVWIHAQGTPGAGGLSYRWRFPCGGGLEKYQEIVARIPA